MRIVKGRRETFITWLNFSYDFIAHQINRRRPLRAQRMQ